MRTVVYVVTAAACAVLIVAPLAVLVALDVEAWQRGRARRRTARADVNQLLKGERPC